MQTRLDDGTWQLEVAYRLPGEHSSRVDTFTVHGCGNIGARDAVLLTEGVGAET
ncbi:MAG: hypothetical protein JWO76_3119 [Nocardioides sp.]|nr:hypothetical protein [Nocardioides sp.]